MPTTRREAHNVAVPLQLLRDTPKHLGRSLTLTARRRVIMQATTLTHSQFRSTDPIQQARLTHGRSPHRLNDWALSARARTDSWPASKGETQISSR